MRSLRSAPEAVAAAVIGAVLAVAGCGQSTQGAGDGNHAGSGSNASNSQSDSAVLEQAGLNDFDPDNFDARTEIDNRWSPARPGTRFVYTGHVTDNGKRVTRRVVSIVSDVSKMVDGVRARVIWDRDYTDGQLEESEIAFLAQDDDGNVWWMGEHPEEFDDGQLAGAPSTWLAGRQGAKPGVLMRVDPRPGTSSYRQGFAPSVDFSDVARPYRMTQRMCVPVGCYRHVLVIDESNPEEPGAHQLKYFASGVGNIAVGWRGPKEEEKETLKLVRYGHLDAHAMSVANKAVLRLDQRAYKLNPATWEDTVVAKLS